MISEELGKRIKHDILTMADGSACTPAKWRARREEIIELLQREIYGYTPKGKAEVSAECLEEKGSRTCAGKVSEQWYLLRAETPFGKIAFPFVLMLPRAVKRPPLFLLMNFRPNIPDEYMPVEEITDNGFGIAMVCYKDMVNDNLHGDYSDGIAEAYYRGRARKSDEWGKIGMWAYGASRVMDCLLARDDVDRARIAVIGHSRLGKTALWAAAQDERFFAAISNNSGFGGAAISRFENDELYGKTGEKVNDFIRAGSWDWYCETFKTYEWRESERPFDQHDLLALIAPRHICVGSAENDHGADPQSEFLSCAEVTKAYKMLGYRGLVAPNRFPRAGDRFLDGEVGYFMRPGEHFLSRTDWLTYMAFLKKHIAEDEVAARGRREKKNKKK